MGDIDSTTGVGPIYIFIYSGSEMLAPSNQAIRMRAYPTSKHASIENEICFEREPIHHQITRQIDEISIAGDLPEDTPEEATFYGSDVSAGDHCVESEISRWLEISILLEVSRTQEANSQEERQ